MLTVGQRVTLRLNNDAPWKSAVTDETSTGPQWGEVYVIQEIHFSIIGVVIALNGWPNDLFDAMEFVPVVDTDISLFTEMLEPSPVKELV